MRKTMAAICVGKSWLALVFGSLFLLSGCPNSETATSVTSQSGELEIGEIKLGAEPTEQIKVGRVMPVSVNVKNPGGKPLVIVWSSVKGAVSPPNDSANVKYTAPNEPGSDRITLEVKTNGTVIATKHLDVSVVSGERLDVLASFIASGWMGDCQKGLSHCTWNDAWRTDPHSPPSCVKVTYRPGQAGWGGIYLQNGENNWGDRPGRNLKAYRRISFWARADAEAYVEFKAGGIYKPGSPHRDSFEKSLGVIQLKRGWQPYTIELQDESLSSVIGAFAWVVKASSVSNPNGLTFYLDDVYYED